MIAAQGTILLCTIMQAIVGEGKFPKILPSSTNLSPCAKFFKFFRIIVLKEWFVSSLFLKLNLEEVRILS